MQNMETGEELYKGSDLAIWPEKGVTEGNVAMPTYRTNIFETIPFIKGIPDDVAHLTDLLHVRACFDKGFIVDWFEAPLYLIRPHVKSEGKTISNGGGQ